MQIEFEHDYQNKVMQQRFQEPTQIDHVKQLRQWRSDWLQALGSWHSPYKMLLDVSNLTIAKSKDIEDEFERMIQFFKGFFLRKAGAFSTTPDWQDNNCRLPFPVHKSSEEASIALGIRTPKARIAGDFRSSIQFQNHFRQHVVELNFSENVVINSKEQVMTLKSKLLNNLMQWHSKWNLMIDCSNVDIDKNQHQELELAFKILNGFFMKSVVGYGAKNEGGKFPFQVYRSRHRAAAILEHEGSFSGDEANCNSRKLPKPN